MKETNFYSSTVFLKARMEMQGRNPCVAEVPILLKKNVALKTAYLHSFDKRSYRCLGGSICRLSQTFKGLATGGLARTPKIP